MKKIQSFIIAAVGLFCVAFPLRAQIPYVEPSASVLLPNTQVTATAASTSAEMLAVASVTKEITLLSMTTLKPLTRIPIPNGRSYALAFTSDGRSVVSGVSSGEIIFWNIASGTSSRVLQHDGGIRSLCLNGQGKMVSGGGTTTKYWDVATGKIEATLPASSAEILQNIFNPQGNLILSASADGVLRLLDPTVPNVVLRSFGGRKIRPTNLAFAPDSRTLAVAYADSTLQLWNAQTGDLLLTARDTDGPILSVAFHPNGRWLLTGGNDIKIRAVATAAVLKSISLPGPVHTLSILPGGSIIAAVTVDGYVNTYRLLDKKPDATPPSITILKPIPSAA